MTPPSMSPSVILTTSAPETILLSRLNGWPVCSPTDASPTSSRMATHGSGPMWIAADAARRIDPGLAEVYWRLMVRKGHHHKQALCAVATRLVIRIGKVLRTGAGYELRDTDGTPISVAQGKAIVVERFSIPSEIRNARRKQRAVSTV